MNVQQETKKRQEDNWALRHATMKCHQCMWFVLKKTTLEDDVYPGHVGRCRRHAPTLSGWPVVMDTDWCGDFKLNEWH